VSLVLAWLSSSWDAGCWVEFVGVEYSGLAEATEYLGFDINQYVVVFLFICLFT
jgi:hypothetical protein